MSDTIAESLLRLQTDLRAFKQQVRQGIYDGHLTERQGGTLLARRNQRFQAEVARAVGAEHVAQYFAIVKDVRLSDRVE